MKFRFVLLSAVFLLGFVLYYRSHPLVSKIKIRDAIYTVEVAATEAQKQKGLGGKASMPSDHGMLFSYDHKEQYNFWMRGMLFPLDFIWIDGNRIVDITENVPYPKYGESPVVVKPDVEVDRILEINAGMVERLGITVGDTVEYMDR